MEGISGGLAVDLFALYWKQLWVERPARGAGKVGVNLTTIVLDEGYRHACRASAYDEALQSLEDLRTVVHRHWWLELIHLGVNDEEHLHRDTLTRSHAPRVGGTIATL